MSGYRDKERGRVGKQKQWKGSDQSPESSFIEREKYETNTTKNIKI